VSQALAVLQATAWYPPHHTGGTEVYVSGLVAGLKDFEVTVLTPRPTGAPPEFEHQGAPVLTYPPAEQGLTESRAAFERLLSESGAQIYHQHSWTPDCGAWHLQAARRAGLKTVLTIHTPGSLCLRGTMMKFGEAACEGLVEERACAACWLHSRGAPRALAEAAARAPSLGAWVERIPGRIGTALSARSLVRERLTDVADMFEAADRVVAVAEWLGEALKLNGAPPGKLSISRQGVSPSFLQRPADLRERSADEPLRVLYLGRWDPVKGLDVVVRAILTRPSLRLRLTIRAPNEGPAEAGYRASIETMARGDARIDVAGPLLPSAVPAALAEHDLLVVPSVWLETGPLVAMEALAMGVPVLGSDLGGLAELIDSPAKGALVAPSNVAVWGEALAAFAEAPPAARSQTPLYTRTTADVAKDMAHLYRELT
jgi:glycosyltransferase involved in cell wall biosynthesis